jgi:regulator of protease activity HflC (stomatin/prohibitin superfamily)
MTQEQNFRPMNGYLWLLIHTILLIGAIGSIAMKLFPLFFIFGLLFFITLPGYFIINPNQSKVLVLFGAYKGTVKSHGFFWANPFYTKKKISLRARNFDTEKIKVNDHLGNPIIISAVVVWKVDNTAQAAFEVDNYENYVTVQSDAALRTLAGQYPYDNFNEDESHHTLTLRSGGNEVNQVLEQELQERLSMAGINVIEARINHLAYSEEIAGAMLQRQQATAIIAARQKIVEGAVGMVDMAIEHLEKGDTIALDEERKAAMISNLLVVLCSDKNPSPVVNTGSIY